jgi:hypothetical protein
MKQLVGLAGVLLATSSGAGQPGGVRGYRVSRRWTPIIRARKNGSHERSGSDPAPATEDAAAAAARS